MLNKAKTRVSKQPRNGGRSNRKIGVAVGHGEEKGGEGEEDGLAVAGKSKEATDLKKNLKML